ncbi:hypothetical protein AAFF_G00236890 [Aldrovandia affinis]|uniref:Uncharacterized protein n=1 Tax=Aldrovandia affinis TaxID=143900 RepID=A0AAD7W421_9TELE|nr:hypothetical protein AAFF_G00236890 [Aldrovandia affinis]
MDASDYAVSAVHEQLIGSAWQPLAFFSRQLGADYNRMAADQATDPDVQAYMTAVTRLELADISFDGTDAALLCDVSTGQPCRAQWLAKAGFQRHPQPFTPRQDIVAEVSGD